VVEFTRRTADEMYHAGRGWDTEWTPAEVTSERVRHQREQPGGSHGHHLEMRDVQAISKTLGLEVATVEIRRAEDIAPAFEALKGRADALYVITDALVSTNRIRINTIALAARLPTMHGVRDYVEAGGLMSYGASYSDLFRRAGDYVDKILRGAKPGELPVEQPTKFDFVINLTTAKALGLEVPPTLLARADEVIE
jgi:putative tryptophan/tyrosine transport system substrate-binding protein